MRLLDLMDQAIIEIEQKHNEAFTQFVQGFVRSNNAQNDANDSSQDHQVNNDDPRENSQSFKDIKERAFQSNSQAQEQYEGISFFEKIAHKNLIALKEFFRNLERVKVQQEPINYPSERQIHQIQKPSDNAQHIITDEPSEILSMSNNYQKSAELHREINIHIQKDNLKPHSESVQFQTFGKLDQNPEESVSILPQKQKTAGQILAEIEQMHRIKSIERNNRRSYKTLSKRTRLIKMKPQMQGKLRQIKQKQAEQRIKVNIDFLQSLKSNCSKQTPNFKEFKKSPKNLQKLKQSNRIKTIHKVSSFRLGRQKMQQQADGNQYKLGISEASNLDGSKMFLNRSLKLPQIQQRKGAPKTKPYSVYNVNFNLKGNEMFVNLVSINP